MKLNQQNKFVRFILRAIDIIITTEMYRRPQMDKNPFQKATEEQKRTGGFFVAFLPVFAALFFGWIGLCVVMTERFGQYSLIPLCLVFLGATYYVIYISIKIAPKIPLSISVPIAVITWSVFAWRLWKIVF